MKEFEASSVPYQPHEILNAPLKAGAINIVFGPRQIGKSTALKLLIQQLLESGTPPQRILYFNCDALEGKQDLIDLVVRFQESITPEGKHTPEHYLLLDEISSVADWPYAVKWLADSGRLENSRIILTGSSSISLKKSGEFLPGRRKGGKDITLLPVSFADGVRLRYPHVPFSPPASFSELRRLEERLATHAVRGQEVYRRFLKTGGFLKAIDAAVKHEPTAEILELYTSTIKSELAKSGKKEIHARLVLKKIIHSLTSETSYANVAEEAELGSKNTAAEYLGFFRDTFLLGETLFFQIPEKRVVVKKNKKYYPTDPFLLWVFHAFVTGSQDLERLAAPYQSPPLSAQLAESFVASELAKQRLAFYYFKNSRELDFYAPELELGIEVKYKDKVTAEDVAALQPARRKVLVSKHTLEQRDDVLVLPVYLFGCVNWREFALS